jgi:uncharacterized protein (DUF885 family)
MKNIWFVLFIALLIQCSAPKEQPKTISLDSLMQNYHEDFLKLYPFVATSAGDARYNDILPNNISVGYRNQVRDFYQRYQDKLKQVDRSSLSEDHALSYDLINYQCDINLEGLKFNDHLMPISQIQSMPLQVAQLAAGTGNQPFKTVKDYNNWLKRLDGFVVWCDTAIANMKKGMANGYVIPKALAVKVVPQLASFDHGPVKEHLYYRPILNIPADFSEEEKSRLEKAYTDIIEQKIIPAHQKLKEFFEKEYIPACRETSGIDAIPNGKDYYNFAIKRYTTTDLTADSIFALGKAEVERISKEMEVIKQQVGFKGDLKAFLESLRTDRKLRPFKTGDDIVLTTMRSTKK